MFYESGLATFPGFALDVLAKSSLLLIAVSILDLAMTRCAAALRHRVWATAFIGLLFLPLLSVVMPEYRLSILPAQWLSGQSANPKNNVESAPTQTGAKSFSVADLDHNQSSDLGGPPSLGQSSSPIVSQPSAMVGLDARSDAPMSRESNVAGTILPKGSVSALQVNGALVCLWCLGALVAIFPLMLGQWRIMVLRRRSPRISAVAQTRTLTELCQTLGIRRKVELLETELSIVPMTWGVRRPAVVLPATWRDWASDRCRLVMLHELAHVKRSDVVYQSIARVACSLFWFHPLAWYALSRLRVERELACDDCVLMAGERPSQYAQQLLNIAREYQSLALPPAVAIVQKSGLEKRVRSMLDQARSHLPLSQRLATGLLFASAAFIAFLAPIRLGFIEQPVAQVNSTETINVVANKSESTLVSNSEADTDPDDPPAADTPKHNQAQEPAKETYVFQGKVIHPDGTPAAGASLHFDYYEQGRLPDSAIPPATTTDANGAFEIRNVPVNGGEFMALVATKAGFGLSKRKPAILFETTGKLGAKSMEGMAKRLLGKFGNDKSLRLVPDDQPLAGRILTVEGTPVTNAQIRVREIGSNTKGNLDGWEKAAKKSKADYYSLRNEAADGMNGFQLPSIVPDVSTDSNGKFTLKGIGKERIVQLVISGPAIETSIVFARTRDGKTIRVPHQFGQSQSGLGQYGLRDEVYYANGFDYVAAPSVPVEGRIVDDSTGDPLSGFLVTAGRQVTFSGIGKSYISTVTDKEGRYKLSGLSQSNEDTLFVVPTRGSKYLPLGVRPKIKDARETVKLDFKLKSVGLLRGQVTDLATGKPIVGAIQYSAMTKNRNLADHRNFANANFHECRTDREGRYEIAVLPGEGVVNFMADDHQRYPRAASQAKIRILSSPVTMGGMYETVPFYVIAADKHFVKVLQIEKESTDTELNIELSSGKSISVKVVKANGEPANNAILKGTSERSGWYPAEEGSIEIQGYLEDQGRGLFAYDPESNQAAYLKISGPQPKEIKMTLQPAGTVRGRLVDKQGVALASARFISESIPEDNRGDTSLRNTTDQDGRFELRGVAGQYKHTVWAMIEGQGMMAIAKDVEVDPKVALDLGDIVYDAK